MTLKEVRNMVQFFAKEVVGLEYPYEVKLTKFNTRSNETSISYYANGSFMPGADYEDEILGDESLTCIEISTEFKNRPTYELINTIIHELIHYKLWYTGHDSKDTDPEFIEECHRLGICSNFDNEWDPVKKVYKRKYNIEKLTEYEEMYKASLA